MSTHESFNALPRLVKSIAVAAALTLPSAAVLSESMDSVKFRADQNIDHPGRDSVYAPLATIVVTPVENPQVYGRAGGYVGADRAAVLESRTSQPADTVKTGESEIGRLAQAHTYESAPAQSPSAMNGSMPRPQDVQVGGRLSGDRFSNPQGAHGQVESESNIQ